MWVHDPHTVHDVHHAIGRNGYRLRGCYNPSTYAETNGCVTTPKKKSQTVIENSVQLRKRINESTSVFLDGSGSWDPEIPGKASNLKQAVGSIGGGVSDVPINMATMWSNTETKRTALEAP